MMNHIESTLIEIWPELIPHLNTLHIIDCQLHTSFLSIENSIVVKDITDAIAKGKLKILFYMPSEGPDIATVTKLNQITDLLQSGRSVQRGIWAESPAGRRAADLLQGICNSTDLIYLTGAVDGKEVYESVYISENWKNKLVVITVNANFHGKLLPSNLPRGRLGYHIKYKEKIFLCFNRMPRQHRLDLLEMMLTHNYVNLGFYSFSFDLIESLAVHHYFDEPNRYITIKNNKNMFPLLLNMTAKRSNPVDLIIDDFRYFEESYFSIVTETAFYDKQSHGINSTFITEKTMKCFTTFHPFIMIGRPHSLLALKKLGYQTFNPMIDESYDSIENDDDRLSMIFLEIHKLMSKTPAEWIVWQTQIKEIVIHNNNIFKLSRTHYSSINNIKDVIYGGSRIIQDTYNFR